MSAEPPMQAHEQAAAQPDDSPDLTGLHDHAMAAEKELEALATGLAQAGADKAAIKTVAEMANVTRQLAKALVQEAHQATPPPQADQPPEQSPPAQAGPQTMASATDSMTNDLRAKRKETNA